MVERKAFLKAYNIDEDDFNAADISWEELAAIYDDYLSKEEKLRGIGKDFVNDYLYDIERAGIHSYRYRTKNPGHLLEKIIRKRKEDPEKFKDLNRSNYYKYMTDLIGIRVCSELMPGVPQVAVFDTAFHQTMPERAYMYALPYEYYEKYKVRRYGFHGTSHRFVSEEAAKMMDRPYDQTKTITCHLGNGGSVCAVRNGKSIDTTMGFTPLEGLVMGTRAGDVDVAAVTYIMKKENLTVDEMDNILNKKSGVLGISGVSSDFRDIEEAAEHGNDRAETALDVFAYKVAKRIGAYAAAMNGVDAIVFTAGLGENSGTTRRAICDYLGFLGVHIDSYNNSLRGKALEISATDSRVRVFVIPTNEELVIARDTKELLDK